MLNLYTSAAEELTADEPAAREWLFLLDFTECIKSLVPMTQLITQSISKALS